MWASRAALILIAVLFLGPEALADDAVRALAPTGRLRVALLTTNSVLVSRDAGPVEIYGLAPDLARTLADRLKVSFQPIRYTTAPQLLEAASRDIWDVTFLTIDPERAKFVDYTPPYLEVENRLLAAPKSLSVSLRDLDVPGRRILVVEGSSNSLTLSRSLRAAELVRAPNYDAVIDILRTGQVDAFADNLQVGLRLAQRVPGASILGNGLTAGRYAMAVPKGNGVGLAYLSGFIERERKSGHIDYIVARQQLQGVGANTAHWGRSR